MCAGVSCCSGARYQDIKFNLRESLQWLRKWTTQMSLGKSSRWCGSSARKRRKKPTRSLSPPKRYLFFSPCFLLFRSSFMLANRIVLFLPQEFNIEKLQLVEAEKKKIRQEYERKERQVEIRKKM